MLLRMGQLQIAREWTGLIVSWHGRLISASYHFGCGCIAWFFFKRHSQRCMVHQACFTAFCWRWHCCPVCHIGNLMHFKALSNSLSKSIETDTQYVTAQTSDSLQKACCSTANHTAAVHALRALLLHHKSSFGCAVCALLCLKAAHDAG